MQVSRYIIIIFFSLIFVSLTIQSYLDNYITRINIELERLFNTIEEEKDE